MTLRDEIQHVVLGMQVNYEGVFSFDEMIKMIDRFFRKRGYVELNMGHKEAVTEKGRTISMRLRPYKPVKKVKFEVQVWINASNLTDVEKVVDGMPIMLKHGTINVKIDAFVIYNERGSFDTRPEYLLIKNIFDKFLFKGGAKDYEGQVKADASELRSEIQSFLNLNKFLF